MSYLGSNWLSNRPGTALSGTAQAGWRRPSLEAGRPGFQPHLSQFRCVLRQLSPPPYLRTLLARRGTARWGPGWPAGLLPSPSEEGACPLGGGALADAYLRGWELPLTVVLGRLPSLNGSLCICPC